jgi:uncharacterized protein (TIGR03083 family)
MTAAEKGPALPDGLRDRVLAASLRARTAGRPEPAAPEITAEEAFSRAADAFYGMLGVLTEEDWGRLALRGLDVQGLVGHLTGVEEDVHRCLAGDPLVARASHVGSTQAAADRQAGRPPAQTRAEWRRAADRTLDLVRAAGDTEVAVHGMRLPLSMLLVVRAFELWIHDNDIRQAAGLPPSVPDPSTLSLMTQAAARLLPHAAVRGGLREPTSVHLVLTGPGGGTWDIPIGNGSPAASVGIVTDAVGFCWLVANRASPDRLDPHITGDPDSAAMVLAAASSLALDLRGLGGQAEKIARPGSGWCWHGTDLDEQPQHVGLREALDNPVTPKMQDRDTGQRDSRAGRGDAHELINVATGHGEPDGADVAIPENLMERELGRAESGEDSLVKAPHLFLTHRLR